MSDVLTNLDDLDLPTALARAPLSSDTKLNMVEDWLMQNGGQFQDFGEELDCFKLTHTFLPGLYIREIFMPAGSVLTTKVHKVEHPFFVLQGSASVYSENDGPQLVVAPHRGITHIGTRRLLVVHEDMVWITVHPNLENITDVEILDNMFTYHSQHTQMLGIEMKMKLLSEEQP